MKSCSHAIACLCGILCLAVPFLAVAQSGVLARFPVDGPIDPVQEVSEGVSIEYVAGGGFDGGGALRIVNHKQAPARVMLFEVDGLHVEDATLEYSARLRSEDLRGMAYLEMWVFLGDDSYFSRGIDKTVAGTSRWLECDTPFFVNQRGAVVDRVQLGIAIEGSGTVYLDDAMLAPRAGTGLLRQGSYGWIAGVALGLMGAVFGSLAGILGPAGKARHLVMGLGLVILVVCVLMLGCGMAAWFFDCGWGMYYPLLLAGGIGTLLFAFMLPLTAARYRQAETRRIAAADMSKPEGNGT